MGEWTLDYPGTSFSFGSRASGFGFRTAPDLGTRNVTAEDFTVPGGDGRVFGQDTIDPDVISFQLLVNENTPAEARALRERALNAWRGDVTRRQPGAVAMLTSDTGRATFGRPRRISPVSDLLYAGIVDLIADFQPVTDLWFGPEESARVGLVPAPGGGLVAPLAAPLATTESSDRSQGLLVGGELDAWPVAKITGPITNPVVDVLGAFRWEFRLSLAYDEQLVIDTRPWVRSILRNGASAAGSLTPSSTRLAASVLPAGAHEFTLRGVTTGTPSLQLAWRSAFTTP